MNESTDWLIYQGVGEPHDGIMRLPPPPPWRQFDGQPVMKVPADTPGASRRLGSRRTIYRSDANELELVNAALYLRRPLLVTGRPGTGKSTLAFRVAHELRLGPVLRWRITSQSTLQEGLYRYNPFARLEDVRQKLDRSAAGEPASPGDASGIARYIRLGPVGTALLPWREPRVLLIDDLDKGDVDLPDDLLDVMEEGEFEIPELVRLTDQPVTARLGMDGDYEVMVERGKVRCHSFPLVVITTNDQRAYSPAFLRRCVRLYLQPPRRSTLAWIVAAHLGPEAAAEAEDLIDRFMVRRETGNVAVDQLLSAVYLTDVGPRDLDVRRRLTDLLFRDLEETL